MIAVRSKAVGKVGRHLKARSERLSVSDCAQKKARFVLPEGAIPHRFQTAARW